MKTMKTIAVGGVAAAALASALGYAEVRGSEAESDQAALAQTATSLSQAIGAAEQHAGGKAVRAELEAEKGAYVYDVEIVNGTQSIDVKVDATDGKVLSAQVDKQDVEGSGDEGSDEDHGGADED
ncbi:MAG: PepSY domain-containing protein [Casimicrobiaceae bacterium]